MKTCIKKKKSNNIVAPQCRRLTVKVENDLESTRGPIDRFLDTQSQTLTGNGARGCESGDTSNTSNNVHTQNCSVLEAILAGD